jgi:hypothetical protein
LEKSISANGLGSNAHALEQVACVEAVDAVILARKLAADGFAVSIGTPAGRRYSADQFNILLTSKSLNSQEVADDG